MRAGVAVCGCVRARLCVVVCVMVCVHMCACGCVCMCVYGCVRVVYVLVVLWCVV